jgi:hypothetical protein
VISLFWFSIGCSPAGYLGRSIKPKRAKSSRGDMRRQQLKGLMVLDMKMQRKRLNPESPAESPERGCRKKCVEPDGERRWTFPYRILLRCM